MRNLYIYKNRYTKALFLLCSIAIILIIGVSDSFSQGNKNKPKKPPYDPEDTVNIKTGLNFVFKPGSVQLDFSTLSIKGAICGSFDFNILRIGLNKKEEFYAGGRGGIEHYWSGTDDSPGIGSPYTDINLAIFGKMEKRLFRIDIYAGGAYHNNTSTYLQKIKSKLMLKGGVDLRIKIYRNIVGLVMRGWYSTEKVHYGLGVFLGYAFIERKY